MKRHVSPVNTTQGSVPLEVRTRALRKHGGATHAVTDRCVCADAGFAPGLLSA